MQSLSRSLDLRALPAERVEILLKMAPTEQEQRLLTDYEAERKPIDALADEDKFVLAVSRLGIIYRVIFIIY